MTNEELKQVLEPIILSAKEARNKADKAYKIIQEEQINDILVEIDKAARQGRYTLTFKTLFDETRKKLRKLGYTVENNDHYGIMIRWD